MLFACYVGSLYVIRRTSHLFPGAVSSTRHGSSIEMFADLEIGFGTMKIAFKGPLGIAVFARIPIVNPFADLKGSLLIPSVLISIVLEQAR